MLLRTPIIKAEYNFSLLLGDEITSDSARWSAVNVSQPLKNVDSIPDNIPILLGSNKHEGELFVHTAFPAPMPKAVVSKNRLLNSTLETFQSYQK